MQSRPQDLPPERLSGSIERVTFHSAQTGFAVLRVKVRGQRELATVVGSAASVSPGEQIECLGHWSRDTQHGLQFRARQLQVVPPSTLEGITRYLGSGMVQSIGPAFAGRLVDAFGEAVFEVIEQHPERRAEVPGIGPKRRARITRGLGRAEGHPRDHGLSAVARPGHRAGGAHRQDLWRGSHRQGQREHLPPGAGHPRHRFQYRRHPGPAPGHPQGQFDPCPGRRAPCAAGTRGRRPLRRSGVRASGARGHPAGDLPRSRGAGHRGRSPGRSPHA